MDETTPSEPTHDLLLALAGRVDDDMLSWARELVAVGEDARAVELVTASVIADRTPLPEPLRASLVAAGRAARIEIDAAALPPTAIEEGTAHRFDAEPAGVADVGTVLRELPARQLQDCRVQLTWRITPAGTAPGPLPHPVVIVEVEPGARPTDVLAYQLGVALERAGVNAAIEVLTSGRMRSTYHKTALRGSLPIAGEIAENVESELWPALPAVSRPSVSRREVSARTEASSPPEVSLFHVEPREPHPLAGEPPARQPAAAQLPPLPRRGTAGKASIAKAEPFRDMPIAQIPIAEGPATQPTTVVPAVPRSPAVGSTAASLLPEELRSDSPAPSGPSDEAGADDGAPTEKAPPAPTPLPLRSASEPGGRRRKQAAPDTGQPAPRPAPRPTTGGQRRLNVTALSRVRPLVPVSDPEPGPEPEPEEIVEAEIVDEAPHPLADPPTFAEMKDPLRGPLNTPLLDPLLDLTIHEDDPLGIGRSSKDEAANSTSDEAGWSREWATGSWSLAPAAIDEPAEDVSDEEAEEPAARHRTFDEKQPEPASDDEDEGEPDEPAPAAEAQPEKQANLGLRPESLARLSDADRQLLARLQAELVNGRPRVSRRAGIANGHRSGPPDLAG